MKKSLKCFLIGFLSGSDGHKLTWIDAHTFANHRRAELFECSRCGALVEVFEGSTAFHDWLVGKFP